MVFFLALLEFYSDLKKIITSGKDPDPTQSVIFGLSDPDLTCNVNTVKKRQMEKEIKSLLLGLTLILPGRGQSVQPIFLDGCSLQGNFD